MKSLGQFILVIAAGVLLYVLVLDWVSPSGIAIFIGIPLAFLMFCVGAIFYGIGSTDESRQERKKWATAPRPVSAFFEPDGYGVRIEARWPANGAQDLRAGERIVEALKGVAEDLPALSDWRRDADGEPFLGTPLLENGATARAGRSTLSFRIGETGDGDLRLEIHDGPQDVRTYVMVVQSLLAALGDVEITVFPQDLARRMW